MKEAMKLMVMKRLMEEKGLSKEEAAKIVESMFADKDVEDKAQYVEKTIGILTNTGEMLSSLPPDIRTAVAPALTQSLMTLTPSSPSFDDDIKKIMIELKMIDMMFGKKDKEKEEYVKKLEEEIKSLREELIKKKEKEKADALMKEIAELKKKLEELSQKKEEKEEEEEKYTDPLDMLMNQIEKAELYKERLRKVLGVEEVKEESKSIDDVIEMLREQGYEIRGPPSWEEIQELQKRWREELERVREEERKRIQKELEKEIQTKRIEATKEIVNNLIKQIVGIFAGANPQAQAQPQTKSNTDNIRELVRKAKAMKEVHKNE